MWNGGKGTEKFRISGAGTGGVIQGSGSDGVDVWWWEMGVYGIIVDSYRRVSSSGGQTDFGK